MQDKLALLSLIAAAARAQQVGTNTPEVHPQLTTQTCTSSGCTTSQNSVVLDANWRWVHSTSGYTNCYTGNTWDASLCPDGTTCANNCALDGADYAGTYGITSSGNALTLKLKQGTNVGSRVYLMNTAGSGYQEFNLLNQEFSFDVDVSGLPCGLNGALYFVNMDADGGMSRFPTNKAGAKYGTGYCDSQCPQDLKFINGEANSAGWTPDSNNANTGKGQQGSCCPEMDIWEANSISAAFTPHPCGSTLSQTACTVGTNCGGNDGTARYSSLCDPDGCDYNSYRMGNTTYYGPGKTVNTNSKFTVVTQFITNTGTATGQLSEIRRIYVQNGEVIQNSKVDIPGVTGGNQDNSITEGFCDSQKKAFGDSTSFENKGGLAAMGNAMAKGMVLVLSLWDDYFANMLWLDSTYPTTAAAGTLGAARGTCPTNSGVPATVESQSGNSQVIFSNIKFGALNSTYAH